MFLEEQNQAILPTLPQYENSWRIRYLTSCGILSIRHGDLDKGSETFMKLRLEITWRVRETV